LAAPIYSQGFIAFYSFYVGIEAVGDGAIINLEAGKIALYTGLKIRHTA